MSPRPTDPGARRRAFVALLALAFAGVATLALLQNGIGDPRTLEPTEAATRFEVLLAVLAAVLGSAAILLGAGAWALWRIGRRTLDTGQFPPPGVVVLRDVDVVDGAAAKRRGNALVLVAAILAVSSLAIAVVGGSLVLRLGMGTR